MAGLEPEPWPGLDDTDAELYYNVGRMRAIADDLEIALALTQGAGGNRDGVTGSVETLTRYFALGEEHIGRWPAASALAHSVGSTGADPGGLVSMEGRGALLTALYQDYVECCQKLVKAIRDSADSYAKTNPGRE
ncbi:hypothetical protein ACNF49_52210 [Actinomadura sp. ATCC 39365]|uniref:hypothetical protein n=1 Tax=Nonomuraea sp. NPDC005692 TaxID=3157168 RepID=UPI0033C10268